MRSALGLFYKQVVKYRANTEVCAVPSDTVMSTIIMFIVRIGVPILITFSLAYLYDYFLARSHTRSHDESSQTSAQLRRTSPSTRDCPSDCPILVRAGSASRRWPNIPCWLAMQLTEDRIADECLACQIFHDANLDSAHLNSV